MKTRAGLVAVLYWAGLSAAFGVTPLSVLDANRAATGGDAWNGKATLDAQYDFAGQGLKGHAAARIDLSRGWFVIALDAGPLSGAQGFDGRRPWNKDNAGIVTPQEGADAMPLAISQAYMNANSWWSRGFGGAQVSMKGEKQDASGHYAVMNVTPNGGASFDAWFDTKSHLLARTVESQGGVAVTTSFLDYKAIDGAELPTRQIVSTGDHKYDQTYALLSARFLPAQSDATFSAPKSEVADFSIASGKSETTIPFRFINNHIYLDVKIDGKGPYSFIVDTGGVNLMTPTLAKSLGLAVVGQTEARGAGTATMQSGFTKIGRLALGEAVVTNPTFVTLPLDRLSNTEGTELIGMVGYETFRRFVTRIDYGARTLTLIDPKTFNPKDAGTAVPIAFNGNAAIVAGTYSGIPAKFQIDTGARSSLTLDAPFVEKNALRARISKSVEGIAGWGTGGPSREYTFRGDTLSIGQVSVTGLVTGLSEDKGGAFADPTIAGNIGGGVLKQFVVTFDYGRRVMYLKRLSGPIADLNTFDRAGLWFNREGDGFRIADVVAHAPADDAGLRRNDLIVTVDGQKASKIDMPALRYRIRNDPPGTAVQVEAIRGGQKVSAKVILRDLI